MENIKIEKTAEGKPVIVLIPNKNAPSECLQIKTAEAYLLLMMLEKLEEIRCGIVDAETATEQAKKSK